MEAKKTYVWKITNNTSRKSPSAFHVWWDGKKVCSDSQSGFNSIRNIGNGLYVADDGVKWLECLGMVFKSGYFSAKRMPDE